MLKPGMYAYDLSWWTAGRTPNPYWGTVATAHIAPEPAAACRRGGVPVCFPQFADFGPLGQHGFARNSQFEVVDKDDYSVTLVRACVRASKRLLISHFTCCSHFSTEPRGGGGGRGVCCCRKPPPPARLYWVVRSFCAQQHTAVRRHVLNASLFEASPDAAAHTHAAARFPPAHLPAAAPARRHGARGLPARL